MSEMAAEFFKIGMVTFENKFCCVSHIVIIVLLSLYSFDE
jgi:hypothetical protein